MQTLQRLHRQRQVLIELIDPLHLYIYELPQRSIRHPGWLLSLIRLTERLWNHFTTQSVPS
jgi:hypothetical protein